MRWAVTLIAAFSAVSGCGFDGTQGYVRGGSDAGESSDDGLSRPPDAAAPTPDAAPPPDAPEPQGLLLSTETSTPPVLDGELDDLWSAAVFQSFSMAEAAHFYNMNPSYGFDAEVSFGSLHDDDNLYLFIEVTDDFLHSDPDTRLDQNDGIELYFDGHGDGGAYGSDDNWIVIGVTSDYVSLGPADADIGGFVAPHTGGYSIEIEIAREDLHSVGNAMGFNIAVIDDDDLDGPAADAYGLWFSPGPSGCAECCPEEAAPQAWCDTSMLGTLVLAP